MTGMDSALKIKKIGAEKRHRKVYKNRIFSKKPDFLKKKVRNERANETSENNFFIFISLSHVDINSFSQRISFEYVKQ